MNNNFFRVLRISWNRNRSIHDYILHTQGMRFQRLNCITDLLKTFLICQQKKICSTIYSIGRYPVMMAQMQSFEWKKESKVFIYELLTLTTISFFFIDFVCVSVWSEINLSHLKTFPAEKKQKQKKATTTKAMKGEVRFSISFTF